MCNLRIFITLGMAFSNINFAYENNEVKQGKPSEARGLGVFLSVRKHKAPLLMLAKHSYRFTAKLVHFLLRHKLAL